jgi:predicted secreted hydrolase
MELILSTERTRKSSSGNSGSPLVHRLTTSGTKSFNYEVTGQSWMDHEFGTSFLEPGQAGWDWFALQLEDGSELMVYAMRRGDGSADPHSSGTLVPASGTPKHLGAADFALAPGRTWTSKATRGSYPVEWSVSVPGSDLKLAVRAALDGQEMSGASGVSYWEGAVEVSGTKAGQPIAGRGYLEMTGYAGPPMGKFLN